MTAISMKGVSKSFVQRGQGARGADTRILPVLDNVDLHVADKEFLCLLGVSGSGKSTILNLICGLEGDYRGEVRFGDIVVPPGRRPPGRIAYVFQEPRLLPWATVGDNIVFGLRSSGVPENLHRERVGRWIERVGLAGFERTYPHELSGGMQQRAALARAFAIDPDILLMDEPFSGLDEFTGRQMREELLSLWRETGKTVLFVTHNCFEASFLADRIVILGSRPGRIAEERMVELPRPRNYDDTRLFELSVGITHAVQRIAGKALESRLPDNGAGASG